MSGRQPRGFSLVEVVVAVAAVAVLGVSLMTLVSSGAQVGARASEMQMACMVGGRVMDRMIGLGYAGLQRQIKRNGAQGILDLRLLERRRGPREPPPPVTRESQTMTVDGFVYAGRYELAEAAPGLVKITLNITWERYGVTVPTSPGNLELARYVADPMVGLAAPVAP